MNTNLKRVGDPEIPGCLSKKFLDSIDENESLYEKIQYEVTEFFKSLRILIKHKIPRYITNMIRWNSTMYNTMYFDHAFLLEMEYKYLGIMLHRYTKYEIIVGQEFLIRDINLLRKLIRLILDGGEMQEDALVNVSNYKRFINKNATGLYNLDQDKWIFKVHLREEKLWNLYNLVRNYRLRSLGD